MSTVEFETFPPFSGGSNLDRNVSEIADDEAVVIQDAFVMQPGMLQQRGPVANISIGYTSSMVNSGFPLTLLSCVDPAGNPRMAVLTGEYPSATKFWIYDKDWNLKATLSGAVSSVSTIPIVQVSPAPNGVMFGYATNYTYVGGTIGNLYYWGGGASADYTNTATTTTRNNSAVTCTSGFTTNVTPGMWVYSGTQLIGQVKTVNSDTSITLTDGATKSVAAGSVAFKSLRSFYDAAPVMTGEITCATTAATVTGGDTKFTKQLADGNTWDLFRWEDFKYIGTVSSVQSDIALTLTAPAALDVLESRYVAIASTASTQAATIKVGYFPAYYANRMWYANLNRGSREKSYRIWFSDFQNEDAVDTTKDGDWFEVRSSKSDSRPIVGTAAAHNSLLVFKEDETFAIYGDSADNFTIQRVFDDGLWSPMSIQVWNGGVLWAGKRGIYYYDGASVTNLLSDKMSVLWNEGLATLSNEGTHMWGMCAHDHYLLNFNWSPQVVMRRSSNTYTPSVWTISINLKNGALTFMSNLFIRGVAEKKSTTTTDDQQVVYVVPRGSTTTGARVCSASGLWTGVGADDEASVDGYSHSSPLGAGPNLYIEAKRYSASDPTTLKKWRELIFNYLSQGAALTLDTIVGLNDTGVTLGTLPTSSTWDVARFRLGKIDQFLGFRLYGTSSNTKVRLGQFKLKYRRLRPGRV